MPNLRQLTVIIAFFCLVASLGKGLFPDVQAAEQAVPSNTPPNKVSPASAATPSGSMSLLSASGKVATRPAHALPGQDEFYDPANPDYNKLQKANESLAGFTLDKKEYVNWMNVLRAKLISPRADLTGKATMEVLDMDIIMKNTKAMPYVKFPHNSHTMWLACSNCHDQIFVPKAGANKINMAKIFRGQYCGVCHDKVAFSMFFSCETCHSVPQTGTKPWWN